MNGSLPACRSVAEPGPMARRTPVPTMLVMGFNPFRKQRTSTTDVAIVVVFVALTLALVAWGFFG